ncbi:type II secretion system protein GspL [Pseudoalteromonas denitrificans]|uniref:Type II secretion system protein L n=1 Tax=Pseudoalteromonas denitrificans DSM 6059 TaxID=1123010 RepID=A0A1I1QGN9_9GAMM|nr:type II secretion system protein GspL [Pseudoalteromonas denitrificans]SFD21239.1 general secretion pathway protein L [Pseudoalteromonas denitrificans DSM 6059]
MSETLIIRLGHSQEDKLHWLIYSNSEHEIIASGELNDANELNILTEKVAGRQLVALLPAADVQLKKVTLPAKWNRKLQQALPFIIEDDLACDLDELFIAIDEPFEEVVESEVKHGIQVAILNKKWFETWLDCLAKFELMPEKVLPDALLLPLEDEKASAICLGQDWLIKTNDWHIAQVEPDWLAPYFTAAKIETLRHFSPSEGLIEFSNIKLESDEANFDLPLAIFAKQLKNSRFNLLQGDYQVKKQTRIIRPVWRAPAIAAGIALFMTLGLKGFQVYQLDKQLVVAKQNVISQYKSAFPGTRVRPHLIKNQLRNRLKQIEGGSDAGFLNLMNDLVVVFKQVESFEPESLRYDNKRKEVRVRARGKDFQTFGKVKSILEKQGLEVSQGSLNNDGDNVVGEVKVRRQS